MRYPHAILICRLSLCIQPIIHIYFVDCAQRDQTLLEFSCHYWSSFLFFATYNLNDRDNNIKTKISTPTWQNLQIKFITCFAMIALKFLFGLLLIFGLCTAGFWHRTRRWRYWTDLQCHPQAPQHWNVCPDGGKLGQRSRRQKILWNHNRYVMCCSHPRHLLAAFLNLCKSRAYSGFCHFRLECTCIKQTVLFKVTEKLAIMEKTRQYTLCNFLIFASFVKSCQKWVMQLSFHVKHHIGPRND